MRRRIRQIDPDIPIYRVLPLEELKSRALWMPRLFSQLFSVFGLSALVLSAVGIYGVIAYSVSRRRQEIGVRLALGARGSMIVRLMLSRLLAPVMVGLLVGTAVSLASTRLLSATLIGVSPSDPLTFALLIVALASVALLAGYLPARRASRTHPSRVLRSD